MQRDVGAIHDAIASYSRSLEHSPDSRNAGQNRLLALNYIYPGGGYLVAISAEDHIIFLVFYSTVSH